MLSAHSASLHEQSRMTISIRETCGNLASNKLNPINLPYHRPYHHNNLTNVYYPSSIATPALRYGNMPPTPSMAAAFSTIQPNFYQHASLNYHPNAVMPSLSSSLPPNYLTYSNNYRNAIELLNNIVKWVKSSSYLTWLMPRDLNTLVEYNWADLFIVIANRWRFPLDTEDMIASLDLHFDGADAIKDITQSIQMWSDIHLKLSSYQLDSSEYEFLLLILLLRSGKLLYTMPNLARYFT